MLDATGCDVSSSKGQSGEDHEGPQGAHATHRRQRTSSPQRAQPQTARDGYQPWGPVAHRFRDLEMDRFAQASVGGRERGDDHRCGSDQKPRADGQPDPAVRQHQRGDAQAQEQNRVIAQRKKERDRDRQGHHAHH